MELGAAYVERVYAGVLGKMVGVYLGRPFEGWSYARIQRELGEITGYVHERLGKPLIVADDDLSGTFAFPRALSDRGYPPDLTAAQIGETWLNEIIEGRTILWWGGMGNATEHTAYLRLKQGIPAPESGSIATNGQLIAEQIGSQIFIDGWAMLCPGDPERAADFARRAASVSHDGAAIHGAQVIAAMEAQAFVETDLNTLLDTALGFIPRDSVIKRLIDDVRGWHAATPDDWHKSFAQVQAYYGYDTFGGNCHIVPNHAVIILGLLHGGSDFSRTLAIVNGCGWDTDCNSGNAGCLLGIRSGLDTFKGGYDWLGPLADRLYVVTAEGGHTVTDAVRESYALVTAARALAGKTPLAPKNGARFHFSLPGSVQGFAAEAQHHMRVSIQHAETNGGSLLITSGDRESIGAGDETAAGYFMTPTFIPPDARDVPGYYLAAAPTLYPGQTIRAQVRASANDAKPIAFSLAIRSYGENDALLFAKHSGAGSILPGHTESVEWHVGEGIGGPIQAVGLHVDGHAAANLSLDWLTWDGVPDVTFARPTHNGTMWRRAWVNAVDQWEERWKEPFRLVQNRGTGLILQGTRDWIDYTASATITPHLCEAAGLAIRAQGLRRYYALLLHRDGEARLVKMCDGEHILASAAFPWQFDTPYTFTLTAHGAHLHATINDTLHLEAEDTDAPLLGGAVALIITEGCLSTNAVRVRP